MGTSLKAEKVGVSKAGLYSKVAAKQEKILRTLFDLLDHKNESVRLGAAKTLINKILPDLQAIQHKGEVEIKLPQVWIPKEKE